ncbi:MAG: hypothetical protein WAS21_19090, partial [Geminicoccaceae bacterium]
MDIGGRGDGAQRQAVGGDDEVVLGPGLVAVGGVGAGQRAAALGPHRTAVDHHVPAGGLGPAADHADQGEVRAAQQGRA